ncbi:MAG: 4Fe-4S dicluster domain-containing protein [Thermodesulfovibrionales bacterium]|nr:4Fe-4S dicluster domain-containing protein [Thermodesulfovibrionales bacterium]
MKKNMPVPIKTEAVKEWVLDKNHLSYWLRQLRKDFELVAPLRERNDIVLKRIDRIHEIALDCPASIPSPKEFLFPQFEPMLTKGTDGISDLRDGSKRVIFGVRSCDVSAVNLLDKFYLSGIADPYYESRRKNTLFISLVCNVPDGTCFCAGLGTGPYLKTGYDIQLYDLGDRYLLQAGSKDAERLVGRHRFLMRKPSKTDHEDQYEAQASSKAMFAERISLEGARQMITDGKVADDFWQDVAERCFECGGCVYECPLCTCFSVIDRKYNAGPADEQVERSRLWDACMFKGFTGMAGGALPAEKRILRTKRWFYHKLIYYPETLGAFGCTGCGRCTITCPGKIDMASVVHRMGNEYSKG